MTTKEVEGIDLMTDYRRNEQWCISSALDKGISDEEKRQDLMK